MLARCTPEPCSRNLVKNCINVAHMCWMRFVPRKIYKSTHVDAEAREKWSKVEFKIEVNDDKSFFSCECGTFEHSGLVCCHALQVRVVFACSLLAVFVRHLLHNEKKSLIFQCRLWWCAGYRRYPRNIS